MLMFVAEIAFLLELIVIAAGLVLLNKAKKESAGSLKLASWILILGGVGTVICTWYYSFKYGAQGAFDTATWLQTVLA